MKWQVIKNIWYIFNNKPIYSCELRIPAFEWKQGWGWPCFDTNLFPFLMEILLKNTTLNKKNMIYIIKQEGLYQNNVNSSLVSTCNCKMAYIQPLKSTGLLRIMKKATHQSNVPWSCCSTHMKARLFYWAAAVKCSCKCSNGSITNK